MRRYRLYAEKETKKKGGEIMKRYGLFIIVLLLILVFGLTQGCSDKTSPTEPSTGAITDTGTGASTGTGTPILSEEIIVARTREVSLLRPDIDILPNRLDFGSVRLGSEAIRGITIKNRGTADLRFSVSSISLGRIYSYYRFLCSDPSRPFFDPNYTTCTLPATIRPGQEAIIEIKFKPDIFGPYRGPITLTDNFTVYSNDPDERGITIPLTGTGVWP